MIYGSIPWALRRSGHPSVIPLIHFMKNAPTHNKYKGEQRVLIFPLTIIFIFLNVKFQFQKNTQMLLNFLFPKHMFMLLGNPELHLSLTEKC